jgi:RluA family pseudouridine synthase
MPLKKHERQRTSDSSPPAKNSVLAAFSTKYDPEFSCVEPEILFSDNHLLIVNKPPGLLSQADRTGDPDMLTLAKSWIKQECAKPGNVYVGLVHRLDRPVSGVLALARTSKAAARLSAQFRDGTPVKKYMALAEGRTPQGGTCRDYLLKDEQQNVSIVSAGQSGARFAELDWQAVAFYKGLSLLDITLKTGRAHQIRAQLASRGMIIAGDVRYGSRLKFDRKNLALHCYCLELEHPVGKAHMRWTAAPPPSWQGFFDREIEYILQQAASSALQ